MNNTSKLFSLTRSLHSWFLNYENLINYNPNKINKIMNILNKRILGVVKGYKRLNEEVLRCKLSKKENCGTKIEIRNNEGQCVNTRKIGL